MKSIKIILLGSLPKGDRIRETWVDWKVEYRDKISKLVPNAKFIDGDLFSDNKGPEVVVGHDLYLVSHSDFAIVHAISKIGAGTAQEILMAKLYKVPVVTIMPKDSHHRKSNIVFHGTAIKDFINPFLYISSDYIAENIDDAARWIKNFNKKNIKVKDILVMEKAVDTFKIKFPEFVKKYKSQGWG